MKHYEKLGKNRKNMKIMKYYEKLLKNMKTCEISQNIGVNDYTYTAPPWE